MKTTRINETMTSNKEMKLLIEGFNKFLNETVESREFDGITTGEVEFNWGSYSSSMKDEKYFIKSDEDALGEIQQNGDPFTYKEEDGNVIVISAPESKKQSIGETVDSSNDNSASEVSAPQIDLTSGINFDRLSALYAAYDSAVEVNKDVLEASEALLTVSGRETLMALYDIVQRRPGTRARIESHIIEELPDDVKSARLDVNNYEDICRDAIANGHTSLDEFVIEVVSWARDQPGENRAELAFNTLKGPVRAFIEAIGLHPLIQESPDNETGGKIRYLWNLYDRQDVSLAAATAIAFQDFDESSSRNISIMHSPSMSGAFASNRSIIPF
jgi:hypothetical protein